MPSIEDALSRAETLTFDCYGTLVDWKVGLGRSIRRLLGFTTDSPVAQLVESYVRTEAEVEALAYRPYRQVMSTTVQRLASQLGVEIDPDRKGLLAEMLPDWPVFADTNEALLRLKQQYRLGVLSNIDRDLFARTARQLEVEFDFVISAEDVCSYKPAHAHFLRLLDNLGEQETVVHVAQSLFHDGAPTGELGLAYVWINRYRQTNDTQVLPLAEFPDLKSFADVACAI